MRREFVTWPVTQKYVYKKELSLLIPMLIIIWMTILSDWGALGVKTLCILLLLVLFLNFVLITQQILLLKSENNFILKIAKNFSSKMESWFVKCAKMLSFWLKISKSAFLRKFPTVQYTEKYPMTTILAPNAKKSTFSKMASVKSVKYKDVLSIPTKKIVQFVRKISDTLL